MRVTQVTLSKNYKIGMPNYSNITIGTSVTWELSEGEDFDFTRGWDIINQQLDIQAQGGTDASWLRHEEYKDHYSTVVKTPKPVSTKTKYEGR